MTDKPHDDDACADPDGCLCGCAWCREEDTPTSAALPPQGDTVACMFCNAPCRGGTCPDCDFTATPTDHP